MTLLGELAIIDEQVPIVTEDRMLAENRIHHLDCLAGLARLKPGSVDLAFADPPFNIGFEYDEYDDRKESEHYLDWSRQWMAGVQKALKPNGTFWVAIGDEYAAELKLIGRELGLTCRSWVIWYYTFGVNCTRKFTRSHAHLFHFVANPQEFTFNFPDPKVRVPSARPSHDTWILRPQDIPQAFTEQEDTWYFSRVAGTFKQREGWHGCQMPEQLLGRIIRATSNPGDLVLDPFGGSGTTLAAAKKLKRRYVGFELSAEYAQRINDRLAGIKPGDALDGVENPLTSAPNTAVGRQLKTLKGVKFLPPRLRLGSQPATEVGPSPAVADESVDLAIADPPREPFDERQAENWVAAVRKMLKPTGTLWVAAPDEFAAEIKQLCLRQGFTCRSWVVWYPTFGAASQRAYDRSHIHLLHFLKDAENFTFREGAPENRIPSARQLVYADGRANPEGRLPDDTWILTPDEPANGLTTLPAELVARIVRTCSQAGDVVAKIFASTAPVAQVAAALERKPCVWQPEGAGTACAPRRVRSLVLASQADRKTLEHGLINAFRTASKGFSADRLVADPELNAAFADGCCRLGLPGDVPLWNRTLLRMRKGGRLAVVPTRRSEAIFAPGCDPYLFACEIALRRMLTPHTTLDTILCDPQLAATFDEIARKFAPGFSSFEYRWGALQFRKKQSGARRHAAQVDSRRRWGRAFAARELLREVTPSGPGVYLVRKGGEVAFAGGTPNLTARFKVQFGPATEVNWESTEICFEETPGDTLAAVMGRGHQLVAMHRPLLNLPTTSL